MSSSKNVSNVDKINPFSFKNYLTKETPDLKNNDAFVTDTDDKIELGIGGDQKSNPFSYKNFYIQAPPISQFQLNNKATLDVETNYDILPNLAHENYALLPSDSLDTENYEESKVDNDSIQKSILNFSIPDELPSNLDNYENNSVSNEVKSVEELKEKLASQEIFIRSQQKKIEKLEKKLKELIEKEKTENTALEQVVQQVEKKLELTTSRAIDSEKLVEVLKQENAQLKSQLKLANIYNTSSERTKSVYTSVNEIAKDLNGAAQTAENSLKALLSGVNHLRLVASNLESLEKISEEIELE